MVNSLQNAQGFRLSDGIGHHAPTAPRGISEALIRRWAASGGHYQKDVLHGARDLTGPEGIQDKGTQNRETGHNPSFQTARHFPGFKGS